MIDVAVVGSLHLDILVEAPRLPVSDETLAGRSWTQKCGGKGGNQAVAAARFGARTAMGGRIGNDDFGRRLRDNLRAAGVDDRCVETDAAAGSGMSVAIQEANGEYGAVIVSGANLAIDATAIGDAWAPLWDARILLLQNEVAEAVDLAAAAAARSQGGRIVLNAAPARTIAPALLGCVDILIVNRIEATALAGHHVTDRAMAERAARALADGRRDVLITLGGDGLLIARRGGETVFQPAFPVRQRSSHGAGDTFCGALAARLALGDDLVDACDFARIAAALHVAAEPGAQGRIVTADVIAARQNVSGTSNGAPA